MKLELIIPEIYKNSTEIHELQQLSDDVKSNKIKVSVKIVDVPEAETIKMQRMMTPSILHKIGIKQTQKTKNLYPTLLVCDDDGKVITFYPQKRRGRDGGEISIKEFLRSFVKGRIVALHEKNTLESLM
ncbi:MAG: hypothetical protein HYS81_01350 [Candidatus Aenigmatarchaeota archaeon]|nr:MAG: hypothetical protein HYS81_01350 [Candidatus Aenigmarchaeota archaeon]